MPQIKGLSQFIADLRNAKAQDDEERRINTELVHIQKLFLDPHLSGYNRKKYVAKLVYIYVLGHRLTFGFMEAILLMLLNVYLEKAMGYFAVSLILGQNNDMTAITLNQISRDLAANNFDENCLALHLLANCGGPTHAAVAGDAVLQLVRLPTTPPFVKKKAALAVLRLAKTSPEFWSAHSATWLPRFTALLDSPDLGLQLAAVLVLAFSALKAPRSIAQCVPLVAKRLRELVIEGACSPDHLYQDSADPWLTVKLLNLTECVLGERGVAVSELDVASIALLRQIVAKAIENGRKKNTNTQSAILFSAVSLATRLDPSLDALDGAVKALANLLALPDTNTRYLVLGLQVKIVSQGGSSIRESVKKHTDAILAMLKDRDILVRQKALQALALVCDAQNVVTVVSSLLEYLESLDYVSRPKILAKIYDLVEQYAGDLSWYMHTTLRVLVAAGPHVGHEIWSRFVSVIVSAQSVKLKTLACKQCIRFCGENQASEDILKTTGFLLGEYGYLLEQEESENPNFSANNQYALLQEKYGICGLPARCIFLTAFLKMYKHFPQLRKAISMFFRQELNLLSTEIQQRSVEYVKLVSRPEGLQMLDKIVLPVPPFAGKLAILDRLDNSSINTQLADLDISANKEPTAILSPDLNSAGKLNPFEDSSDDESPFLAPVLSPNWAQGFYTVLRLHSGVLYENSLVRLAMRLDSSEAKLNKKVQMSLRITNKLPVSISSLLQRISMMKVRHPPIIAKCTHAPESTLQRGSYVDMELEAMIRSPFKVEDAPILELSFLCGGFNSIKVRLPCVLITCLSGTALLGKHFAMRWSQLEEAGRGCSVKGRVLMDVFSKVMKRGGWGECEGGGQDTARFGGIIHTHSSGSFGTLVEAQERNSELVIMVRSTSEEVGEAIAETLNGMVH